ncbi:GNAT family N-acetyltransferase [Blastococcus deserti]|uniref:GNAT family N-acetyltransferase n=1 Tax=Blastococcus deserti TaxID=2259033 RepID=A0ABW4XDM8_9ACTN
MSTDQPGTEVRVAGPEDLAQVPLVETRADESFRALGITGLPAAASAGARAEAWRVLVTGRPVRGFAVLELVDGAVHLEQLSVDPAHGRRGLGTALLHATVRTAREHGVDRVTLLTYADVPWNGPWYARHGWRETTDLTPGLRELRDRERQLGLDRHGRRIAMVRPLTPTV